MEGKRRIRIQNGIIIGLLMCIILLSIISGTAAWYIVSKEDSTTIYLANPVNVSITENNVVTENILRGTTLIYPGDKIKLKLGLKLVPKEGLATSSPAHVRAKLLVTYEENGAPNFGDYIEIKQTPSLAKWTAVDYSSDPNVKDIWYVYGTSAGATVVNDQELVEFVDGYIQLSVNMTNKYANRRLNVAYRVEAIQTVNTGVDANGDPKDCDPITQYRNHTWYRNGSAQTD